MMRLLHGLWSTLVPHHGHMLPSLGGLCDGTLSSVSRLQLGYQRLSIGLRHQRHTSVLPESEADLLRLHVAGYVEERVEGHGHVGPAHVLVPISTALVDNHSV